MALAPVPAQVSEKQVQVTGTGGISGRRQTSLQMASRDKTALI